MHIAIIITGIFILFLTTRYLLSFFNKHHLNRKKKFGTKRYLAHRRMSYFDSRGGGGEPNKGEEVNLNDII